MEGWALLVYYGAGSVAGSAGGYEQCECRWCCREAQQQGVGAVREASSNLLRFGSGLT